MKANKIYALVLFLIISLTVISGCGEAVNTTGSSVIEDTVQPHNGLYYEPEESDTQMILETDDNAALQTTEAGDSSPRNNLLAVLAQDYCAMIPFNEMHDGEKGLFYLGQSLEDVYYILDAWGVDRQAVEHIESTGDFDDWHWGYTSIVVSEFGLSFVFDLEFLAVDISTFACEAGRTRSISQMGLVLGDSYERMVEIYGNTYTRFIPEFWGEGAMLFEYNFGNNYFGVLVIHGEVVNWGISAHSYELLAGYRNAELEVVEEFVVTMQIHENGLPLTFYRRVLNTQLQSFDEFPEPTAVEVVIKNESGIIFQVIQNLTQSAQFLNSELSFSDYNFDGYLDMRLMRWQENGGKLIANEYFWLWDNMLYKFVLNEQLMEIGRATRLYVNQETSQIEVWRWTGPGSTGYQVVYEYRDGVFIRTY